MTYSELLRQAARISEYRLLDLESRLHELIGDLGRVGGPTDVTEIREHLLTAKGLLDKERQVLLKVSRGET